MTRHNPSDDALARTALERALAEVIVDAPVDLSEDGVGGTTENALRIARAVAKAFEFVEYDRARTSVPRGNGQVHLPRFVLTGGWEVDPAAAEDAP